VQNLELIEITNRLISMLQHLDVGIFYYQHDYGWNVRRRFSDSDIHISEKSRRTEYYDLHVVNCLGAAWLETLAANMPTICFDSRERHLFREGVQPYTDALTYVGILHDSVDSAAAKILEVQQLPQRWWLSDEVQDIRESFGCRYARMEDMWLDSWVEEFSNIASEVGDGGYLR
jgi:putative transferase (TIGR04331 family)